MKTNRYLQRHSLLLVAGMAWVACGMSSAVEAASLSQDKFRTLAARCAPAVAINTIEAVTRTESGLDPWALHDNTTGVSTDSSSFDDAAAIAHQWIARGDSVDLGLMQVNSANLPSLGMSIRAALDPCASLAAGAAILRAAYGDGDTPAEQQVALLMALSRYNTGSPFKGILNGYARRIIATADEKMSPPSATAIVPSMPELDAPTPPAWNVSASATYAQAHGAAWLVAFPSASASDQPRPTMPLVPVQVVQDPSLSSHSTSSP